VSVLLLVGVFAIDGGLLTVVDLKTRVQAIVSTTCSMGNGRFFSVLFILKKKRWIKRQKRKKLMV
jgi:hypothetical protein